MVVMTDKYNFSTVEEAIADIAAGKCVIVADDEDRENALIATRSAQLRYG